jgi:hypothetical protein
MRKSRVFFENVVAHINRKEWWHVPPRDPSAYSKRGKFLASSFREFLRSYVVNDRAGMRAAVREIMGKEA